jgi:hypothetical protein
VVYRFDYIWGASALEGGAGLPSSVRPNNNSVIGASYQRPNATGVSPQTSGSATDRINDRSTRRRSHKLRSSRSAM